MRSKPDPFAENVVVNGLSVLFKLKAATSGCNAVITLVVAALVVLDETVAEEAANSLAKVLGLPVADSLAAIKLLNGVTLTTLPVLSGNTL